MASVILLSARLSQAKTRGWQAAKHRELWTIPACYSIIYRPFTQACSMPLMSLRICNVQVIHLCCYNHHHVMIPMFNMVRMVQMPLMRQTKPCGPCFCTSWPYNTKLTHLGMPVPRGCVCELSRCLMRILCVQQLCFVPLTQAFKPRRVCVCVVAQPGLQVVAVAASAKGLGRTASPVPMQSTREEFELQAQCQTQTEGNGSNIKSIRK